MRVDDPATAHRIVSDYLVVLDRDLAAQQHPAPLDTLPHSRETIRRSLQTVVATLAAEDRLTSELTAFLRAAYVSLAEYVAGDLVRLLAEYDQAGRQLGAEAGPIKERVATNAWQQLSTTSALVASVAKSMADDGAALAAEFDALCDHTVSLVERKETSHVPRAVGVPTPLQVDETDRS
jgi:hypothetical protein